MQFLMIELHAVRNEPPSVVDFCILGSNLFKLEGIYYFVPCRWYFYHRLPNVSGCMVSGGMSRACESSSADPVIYMQGSLRLHITSMSHV